MYRWTFMLSISLWSIPQGALACAVCFGGNDAMVRVGIPLAVLTLLGILLCVLGGFVGFFIHLRKKQNTLFKNI